MIEHSARRRGPPSPFRDAILALLRERGSLTSYQAATGVGCSQKAALKHLRAMVADDLAWSERLDVVWWAGKRNPWLFHAGTNPKPKKSYLWD